MINYPNTELKDILQMVNIAFPIFLKLISSIKAKFGKQKGSKIFSRLYQELLKPNPDMDLITDMFTEIEKTKAKPIAGLARAKSMKYLIEEYQKTKPKTVFGVAKMAKAKKIIKPKISSRKCVVLPKMSAGILISEKSTGKGKFSKSKSKVIKRRKRKI